MIICKECTKELEKYYCKEFCKVCYDSFRYYSKQKEILEQKKNYRKLNNKEIKESKRLDHIKNKERANTKSREYYKINKDKIFKSKRVKEFYFVKLQIRNALCNSLKYINCRKSFKTLEFLGMTRNELINKRNSFLNKPCSDGRVCGSKTIITIENSHCDHFIPLRTTKNLEDVYRLNQLDNLRWICGPCNLSKGGEILNNNEKEK